MNAIITTLPGDGIGPDVVAEGVRVLAQWGIATGVLEVLAAAHVPRSAGHWLLLTGGISSLFLAFVLLILPHADVDSVVHLLVAYAEVFGFAVLLAAFWFGQRGSDRVGYARTAH